MPDRAHEQTNALLIRLERELNTIYDNAARKIRKISLDEIYLDNPDATQKQRLDYAKRHGLNKLIKELTPIILDANETAIKNINAKTAIIYAINHNYAVEDIERQAKRSIGVDKFDITGKA